MIGEGSSWKRARRQGCNPLLWVACIRLPRAGVALFIPLRLSCWMVGLTLVWGSHVPAPISVGQGLSGERPGAVRVRGKLANSRAAGKGLSNFFQGRAAFLGMPLHAPHVGVT